ncbi:MAG: hypothetical protein JWP72_3406 [Massilia sp.]|jgi:hypothetical protein|nr:hypothetical protein [Massilia sp.]MDB5792627.1 hypothetical protein [Massilia sp.]
MTLTAVDAVAFPGATTTTIRGEARRDARQRVIVDDAIALLGSSNIMSAFEYLRTHDIDGDVIERVLLEPLRRRATA